MVWCAADGHYPTGATWHRRVASLVLAPVPSDGSSGDHGCDQRRRATEDRGPVPAPRRPADQLLRGGGAAGGADRAVPAGGRAARPGGAPGPGRGERGPARRHRRAQRDRPDRAAGRRLDRPLGAVVAGAADRDQPPRRGRRRAGAGGRVVRRRLHPPAPGGVMGRPAAAGRPLAAAGDQPGRRRAPGADRPGDRRGRGAPERRSGMPDAHVEGPAEATM
jgi:hypothetical protein